MSDNAPSQLQLKSIIPLDGEKTPTVESVTSLNRDTVGRHYSHLVVKLSPRRIGMSLGNALDIAAGRAPRKP
jgi:hypothetical protein